MKYLTDHEEQQALEYIQKAAEIALQATCERARCGCVIVENDEIIGTGFNSPPGEREQQRRCKNNKDEYNKKVTDKTCCVHAEQRAIMNALIDNPDKIIGSRLYFIRIDDDGKTLHAGKPYCTICSKMALDAGIGEFILRDETGVCVYDTDEYNTLSFNYSQQYMKTKINTLKLGDKKHHFTQEDLPALIHYPSKTGGSHYSMVLIENLALQGAKVLIFTGYPAAKEMFFTETKTIAKDTVVIEKITDIEKYKDKQVIVINNDDEKLCLTAIKKFEDIDDRIIFIKNIDICHTPLLKECIKHKKIILSGDLDTCKAKEIIRKKKFTSTILFSQPKIKIPYTFVPLEPYTGYIRSKNTEGYVRSVPA